MKSLFLFRWKRHEQSDWYCYEITARNENEAVRKVAECMAIRVIRARRMLSKMFRSVTLLARKK